VHNEAVDEADALAQVQRFLSYLPRSVFHTAPVLPATDDPDRADDWLKDAIPRDRRKIYDPRKILASIMDRDSVFEIGRWQGGSVITALARLNGIPVGVIANDPKVQGGAMTIQAAYKMERHVKLCSLFGLPVVNFVDQPGNQTGLEAELGGTLLGATRVGEALNECRSPWVSILIRRCFGMAGALHAPKYGEALNLRYAWPSARWGSIPIEGRRDGRAQGRDRDRARPRRQARRAGGVLPEHDLALPHGGEVRHPGHHRPARDPRHPVRLDRGRLGESKLTA
jgi:acetyl-CoA carboxylase carboxyltransferase component